MSAGDYIELKRYRAANNALLDRTAGNIVRRSKINEIIYTIEQDEYSEIIPNTWFGVNVLHPDICWDCAEIFTLTNEYPLIFSNPMISSGLINKPKYCRHLISNTQVYVNTLSISIGPEGILDSVFSH